MTTMSDGWRPYDESTTHHERAVAAFLSACDPARIAALELCWPVLSVRQMRRRMQREIPMGDSRDVESRARRVRQDGRR